MRAVLLFTLVAALCIAGAWWVAGLPGAVSATIAGTTIETTVPVALTLLAVLFIALYILIRLLVAITRIPRATGRWRREKKRSSGDAAVTRTLIALAANDAGAARREAERSRRLLGDTPLTLLLAAQADRQAGRENQAAEIFKRLASSHDGRLLGLRGLLRQAMAREDWVEASALAAQAEAAHPGAAWLTEERQRMAVRTGQWQEALRLAGPAKGKNAPAPAIRAALATAAAVEETDPAVATRLAKQAFEAEPSLAPAAIAYATRLRASGRERPALEVLKRAWALLPQPDVATTYLAPVTDPVARHRAAAGLVVVNPGHPDSALLLARTALDAGLLPDARRHGETARMAGLNDRRLWVLLADIAETEGDADAAQEALRHIPGALPEPAWRCLACGTVHQEWHPVCDACGTPGQIKWVALEVNRTTVQRLLPPATIEGLG